MFSKSWYSSSLPCQSFLFVSGYCSRNFSATFSNSTKILAENIKVRMKGTGFSSVSSYVIYVLRQVLSSIEEEQRSKQAFTKDEEDKVKQRLRDLGYID